MVRHTDLINTKYISIIALRKGIIKFVVFLRFGETIQNTANIYHLPIYAIKCMIEINSGSDL